MTALDTALELQAQARAAWRGKVQALVTLWQAIDALPAEPADDPHLVTLRQHAGDLEAEVLAGP